MIGAFVALCVVVATLLARVTPARAAAAGGAVSLAITVSYPLTGGQRDPEIMPWLVVEAPALLVLTLLAARRGSRCALLPGLAVALVLLRGIWRDPALALSASAAWALPAVAVAGAGLYLRSLDQAKVRAVASAVQEQRLAFARDLHDFVAHDVSGMLVQAQAARFVPGLPAPVADALRRIEDGGQRALASLDRTVHMLNQPGRVAPSPGLDGLRELAEGFPPSTRVTVTMEAAEVSREASATAYRVASEALTNVRRHAPRARKVGITVTGGDREVRVRIEDDGGGHSEQSGRRGGFGLAGLSELLTSVGGSLDAGPHGDGWRVTAVIPA